MSSVPRLCQRRCRRPNGRCGCFKQRIAGKTVGAVQPGGGCFTASPKPINRTASRFINCNAPHVVVSRRPYRDGLDRRVEPGGAAPGSDTWEALAKARAKCRAGIDEDAMSFGEVPPNGAGNHIARFKVGTTAICHDPLSCFVDEHGALAAHRLANQWHRIEADVEGGGMELNELHIGEYGAGTGGKRQSLTDRSKRVACFAIKSADASGRKDDARGRQKQRSRRTDRKHASYATILHQQTSCLDFFEHHNSCRATDGSNKGAHDLPPGSVAAGMKDASSTMRSLKTDIK
jgi:hypothetical protein